MRQHGGHDLRIVAISVGKQRADRAVDQAGNKRLLFRRPALALEIAAGNAPRRKSLFLIIDRQGKEIDPGLGLLHGDDGGEHRGFAIGRNDSSVGLAGNLAGFEHKLSPGPIEFLTMDFKHFASFWVKAKPKPEQDGEQLRNSGWRSCHMDWSSPDTARRPNAAAFRKIQAVTGFVSYYIALKGCLERISCKS